MDLNRANRQCCDLDFRDYKTNEPILWADFGNATTAGFSGESVYASIKSAKAIAFHNPIEGTMSIEFQCHPFKIYAFYGDGTIETTGIDTIKETYTATQEGKITLQNTPITGSVFVYAEGKWGETSIVGTVVDKVFTATTVTDIAIDKTYEIGYFVEKTTGVKRVVFNNKKVPKDLRVTMSTLDKDEEGTLVPCKITAYKANIKRNLELSFSSDGDPASIKMEFDCLEDKDGNVLDIMEITE